MPPCNRFTSKLKHTDDRNAASSQGAFRFACVQDRGCRGNFAGRRALSVLLMQKEGGTMGFGAFGGRAGGASKLFAQYMIFQLQLHTLQMT